MSDTGFDTWWERTGGEMAGQCYSPRDIAQAAVTACLADEKSKTKANEDRANAISRLHGEMFDLASSFRDTLCRVLDTAERRTKAGKPLEQDEIDAMTARLVDDTKKLYGEPRAVPPHRSGGPQ